MKHTKFSICVFILFFFTVSCQKDEVLPLDSQALSIKEAKEFYEKLTRGAKKESENRKIIIWDDGISSSISKNESFVTVPLVYLDQNGVAIEDSRNKKSKDKEYTNDIVTNLIVRKKDGVLETFILRLVKDEESYLEKKESIITKANFDGYALLLDLNGNPVSSSVFKDGKEILASSNESKKGRPNDMAVQVCVTYYSQACVEGYGCGPVFSETVCETYYMPGEGMTTINTFFVNFSGGGGGFGSISSFEAFDDLPNFWDWLTGTTLTERTYYLNKPYLIPNAIASYKAANEAVMWLYCNNDDLENANAFKHAFWSATNAMLNSSSIAFQMGNAHEAENDANLPYVEMDIINNSLGINTYATNKNYINTFPEEQRTGVLMYIILQQIVNGYGTKVDASLTNLIPTTSSGTCH